MRIHQSIFPHGPLDRGLEYRLGATDALDRLIAREKREWLSERELGALELWRNPGRRQAWLRSRMLAKRMVRAACRRDAALPGDLQDPGIIEFPEIEILAPGGKGRPQVLVRGVAQPWSLSVAHSDAAIFAALSWQAQSVVGVDVTPARKPSDDFVRLWYTAAEIAWLHATERSAGATFLWAAKESLYKACNHGEGFDPRRIEVLPGQMRYHDLHLPQSCMRAWTTDTQIAVLVSLSIDSLN